MKYFYNKRQICYLSFSLCFLFFTSANTFGKNIEFKKLQRVAINAFSHNTGVSKESLQIKDVIPVEENGEAIIRIFNFSPTGYIIISCDDNALPVLGYGENTNFSFGEAPSGLIYLIKGYEGEIKQIKEKKLLADNNILKKWEEYSSEEYVALKSYNIGTYLLETNWTQGSPYNANCPIDPVTGVRCVVGCTAVAMGQILHYWGCKVFPDGTNSYTPERFTSPLQVNFYQQTYNWDNMSHSAGDSENAKLLYHCGVAANMNYGSGGSWSTISYAESGLKTYFGFATNGIKWRSDYSNDDSWINLLKADIDAGLPIYYNGQNLTTEVGHAWVVDGYRTTNEFHCNWGWGSSYNSWCLLSALNLGTYTFSRSGGAITGLRPVLDACSGLTGNDVICSSNSSYSISIPSAASVVWSKTGNLTQVGNNTGNTYTVYATSSSGGAGSITATIKNSQGQTFLTRTKSVWGGKVEENKIVSSREGQADGAWAQYRILCSTGYTTAVAGYDSNGDGEPMGDTGDPSSQSITAYEWSFPSGWSYSSTGSGIPNERIQVSPLYYPSIGQMVQVGVRAQNGCGWTNWKYDYWQVVSCGSYSLMVSPNPSTSESTISLLSENNETAQLISDWNYEIYDSFQGLKEKKTKLKTSEIKINTSGWKDGVYIVRATIGDKVLTEKMIVKH